MASARATRIRPCERTTSPTRLRLEVLEDRQLLTVTISGNGNTDSASLIAAAGPGGLGTPGFVNVGESSTHNASITYLGGRWCLTAAHVTIDNGVGLVRFGGNSYTVDMGTITPLVNFDATPTDLKVFQITTDPGLPSILPSMIVSATPTGRQIMIGNGLSTGVQKYWNVNTVPDPWVWTEQSPPLFPGPNDASGYTLVNGRTIRWGENNFGAPLTLTGGGLTVYGYTTTFDDLKYTLTNPLPSEAQGTNGDSGGAVFALEGGQWKLAGIMDAISDPLSGQPANTNIFGYQTFIADLSKVRNHLLSVTASQVVGRNLFYAGSTKWNVTNANLPGFSDDNAIAPDKTAYIANGSTSTFNNVSSYIKGINGLMIDLSGAHGAITANDFIFKVGNNNSPSTWSTAVAPTLVTTRSGAGAGGSDRIELLWADGAVSNTWLEVVVRGRDTLGGSNANTGLAASDVFFFGSAPADSGTGNTSGYLVNTTDELSARNDPHGVTNPATIANVNDFDRNGLVNANDQQLTRTYATSAITQLKFLSVGGGGPFAPDSSPAVDSASSGDAGIASALAAPLPSAGTALGVATLQSLPLSIAPELAPAHAAYFQSLGDTWQFAAADEASDALDEGLASLEP